MGAEAGGGVCRDADVAPGRVAYAANNVDKSLWWIRHARFGANSVPAGLYREVAGNYGPRLASTQLRWCESGRGVAGTAHLRQRRSLRSTFAKRSLRSPLRLAGSLAPVGSLRMPLRNSLASQPKPASEASGLAKAGGEGGFGLDRGFRNRPIFEIPQKNGTSQPARSARVSHRTPRWPSVRSTDAPASISTH